MTRVPGFAFALVVATFAGPSRAGEPVAAANVAPPATAMAWVGDYRVRDAHGERDMTVIRDATRVEYRIEHRPVRVWHRVGDGVALQELHPERGEMLTYTPGDLRARDREPDWAQISSLVDPALRTQLTPGRETTAHGERVQRFRGKDAQGHAVELDWLATSAMPARYHLDDDAASETIELRALHRVPSEQAFTPTTNLHESDGADLGD